MIRIEIYSKQWCPYCTKAKALLSSKALEYQVIDITHNKEQERRMMMRSRRQTVPQIFIDGVPIGGYDDIANLNATGELDRMLGLSAEETLQKIYDVVIVGAGPAGLSAALYAARKNLSVAIVSMDIGGQMGTTAEIENYPGVSSISGPQLVAQFEQHATAYDIKRFIGEKVVALDIKDRCRVVKTASGKSIHGRTAILASGADKRKLNVPGERELAGKGVVYCATCDGPLFKDRNIVVIGGGNSALEATIEMAGLAASVTLISIGNWTGDAILQDKVNSANVKIMKGYEAMAIHGETSVTGIEIRNRIDGNTQTLAVDGVFIEIGLAASTDYVLDLLDTNDRGEIQIEHNLETGVRGVFAAGDVNAGSDKQVVIAAAEGAKAALAAFSYLAHQV